MPDTYTLTLTLEKNGTPIGYFDPLIRRITVDQSQSFDALFASGGGDVALPIAQVGVPSLLILTVDQLQTYKPGTVTINPGGLIVLFNATSTTETLANASGVSAHNKGVAGGS